MNLAADPSAIVHALQVFLEPGQVVEIRALNVQDGYWTGTMSGYYDSDHLEKLAEDAAKIRHASGIYWTLNPMNPALLARASNRLRKMGKRDASTSDPDIIRRRWFLIDLDARRPSGISASDQEKAAAFEVADQVAAHLQAQGWPEPVRADSGNGAHLYFRIDLPAQDGGLVKRCLEALQTKFGTVAVDVDGSVFNPSRISKLLGTPVRKGDDTPDRPHRMARLLSVPESIQIVPTGLLEALAGKADEPRMLKNAEVRPSGFDVGTWLDKHGLAATGPEDFTDNTGKTGKRWVLNECPFRPEDGPSFAVLQFSTGRIAAGCRHNTCPGSGKAGNRWRDLRAKFGEYPSDTAGGVFREEDPGGDLWAGTEEPQAAGDPLRILDTSDWGFRPEPPLDWIIRGVMPQGQPGAWAGRSNSGKSLGALQVGQNAALGHGLWGLPGPRVPLFSLYLSMEDGPEELERRWARCLAITSEDFRHWTRDHVRQIQQNFRPVVPDWRTPTSKTLPHLVDFLKRAWDRTCPPDVGPGMIFLDTLAAISPGEENAAETHQAFWSACHSLTDATGATIVAVHHSKKPQGIKPPKLAERLSFDFIRGSSAIVAGARFVLQMEPLLKQEAEGVGLAGDRADAGNFPVLHLSKQVSGPKGDWFLLQQRQAHEQGGGFFTPHPDADSILARLKGQGAVRHLNQMEGVLVDLFRGVQDREALIQKHWPALPPEEAAEKLKRVLSDMRRTPRQWLQPGKLDLTSNGFLKAQAIASNPDHNGVSDDAA